jgi:acetolactate synthase I/II/III large subunit
MATVAIEIFKHIPVKDVFVFTGGGAMYLNDALAQNTSLNKIFMHHEQALAYAMKAYATLKGFGVCVVTSGPGSTNCITPLAEAYLDSVPCLFISGQANYSKHGINHNSRQVGLQEIDIINIVKPITKYAAFVNKNIAVELQKAIYIAKSDRMGPVWLDIPLYYQNALIGR